MCLIHSDSCIKLKILQRAHKEYQRLSKYNEREISFQSHVKDGRKSESNKSIPPHVLSVVNDKEEIKQA